MEKLGYGVLKLREITLRRVAVVTWSEPDILALFQKLPFKLFPDLKCESEWLDTMERKVKDNVSKLVLPESLTLLIMPLVRNIGSEILRWKMFHEKFLGIWREDLDISILERLCWTSAGIVDYQRTAQEFIRLEVLDIVKLYKLACLYCLEDDIPIIWKELPENCKKCFYKQEIPLQAREPQMEFCWAYVLKEQESNPDFRFANPTFYQNAFEFSAAKANKAATEYFLEKLTYEERETSLMRTAHAVMVGPNSESRRSRYDFPQERLNDVFCYLFFSMTREQHMELCQSRPFDVLRCFVEWPWQDAFADVAGLVWTFHPESAYQHLLDVITKSMTRPDKQCPRLFRKFFVSSPSAFRKLFVDRECQLGFFFSRLFLYGDKETVKVIFRNLDVEDRTRFVSCHRFFEHFDYFSRRENWLLIELCLREAMLTPEGKEKVKVAYMEYLTYTEMGRTDFREGKWRKIIEFLDASAPAKRSSEESTLTGLKKLR